MLCGRRSPPQPRRRLLKVCGKASSLLASTLATTKVWCPTARANRREVLRRFALSPSLPLSVDAVHADDPFAILSLILSSDLTSSFRQILHLTVARKSLVNDQ